MLWVWMLTVSVRMCLQWRKSDACVIDLEYRNTKPLPQETFLCMSVRVPGVYVRENIFCEQNWPNVSAQEFWMFALFFLQVWCLDILLSSTVWWGEDHVTSRRCAGHRKTHTHHLDTSDIHPHYYKITHHKTHSSMQREAWGLQYRMGLFYICFQF